jgi:uncharacterized protein (DUF1330 family)
MKDLFVKIVFLLIICVPALSQNTDLHQNEGSEITGIKQNQNVFLILEITVNDSILYNQYRIEVEPLIKMYGGSYLVRSGGMEYENDPKNKVIMVEGNWNPNRFIIIQWDSLEKLQKFSTSQAYKSIELLRTNSAKTKSIIVNQYFKN